MRAVGRSSPGVASLDSPIVHHRGCVPSALLLLRSVPASFLLPRHEWQTLRSRTRGYVAVVSSIRLQRHVVRGIKAVILKREEHPTPSCGNTIDHMYGYVYVQILERFAKSS